LRSLLLLRQDPLEPTMERLERLVLQSSPFTIAQGGGVRLSGSRAVKMAKLTRAEVARRS
jgi:hypothetical protein